MSSTRKAKNARRAAVVMAGVAAAGNSPTITSATIYACYSNTTNTLFENYQD